MPHYLLDTDILTHYAKRHLQVRPRVDASLAANEVAISAVTVGEALRGRLAAVMRRSHGTPLIQAYANLVETVSLLQRFPILNLDSLAESERDRLTKAKIRIGTMDLRIACIALTQNLTVVTANTTDFIRIPNLLLEDWTI